MKQWKLKKIGIVVAVLLVLIILTIAAVKLRSRLFAPVVSNPTSYTRKDLSGPIDLAGQDKISVVVHTGQGNTDFYPVDYVPGEPAYKHLLRLDAENPNLKFTFAQVGDKQYLTGINELEFKLEGDQYWELLLNGDPVSVTLSDLYLKSGDVIEFRISNTNN
jgi:hypothetical protein